MPVHNDADNSSFLEEQLRHIKKTPIEVSRPDIKWREIIPPASEPAPAGSMTIRWQMLDRVGQARLMADYETEIPMCDIFTQTMTSPVHNIGVGYHWTIQEMDHARMAGLGLTAERRKTAMEAAERELQRVALVGDPTLNIPGMLTNPNVATVPAAVSGGNTTWADKLANGDYQGVLRDIGNVVNSIPENTFGKEGGNTFLLPLAEYNRLNQYHVGVDNNRNLLTMAKESHPGVEFDWLTELDAAGPLGVKTGVFYDRNSRVLGREVPKEPTEIPAQWSAFRATVPVHGTTGGCPIMYPAAVKYFTGF